MSFGWTNGAAARPFASTLSSAMPRLLSSPARRASYDLPSDSVTRIVVGSKLSEKRDTRIQPSSLSTTPVEAPCACKKPSITSGAGFFCPGGGVGFGFGLSGSSSGTPGGRGGDGFVPGLGRLCGSGFWPSRLPPRVGASFLRMPPNVWTVTTYGEAFCSAACTTGSSASSCATSRPCAGTPAPSRQSTPSRDQSCLTSPPRARARRV
jgi:hypothetical protein